MQRATERVEIRIATRSARSPIFNRFILPYNLVSRRFPLRICTEIDRVLLPILGGRPDEFRYNSCDERYDSLVQSIVQCDIQVYMPLDMFVLG